MKFLLKLTTFTLFSLILAGCANKYWYNSRSGADYNSDNYQCELSARQNTIPQRYGIAFDDIRYNSEKSDLYKSCMYARGWYLSEKQ